MACPSPEELEKGFALTQGSCCSIEGCLSAQVGYHDEFLPLFVLKMASYSKKQEP